MRKVKFHSSSYILLFLIVLGYSCTSSKNAIYFSGQGDTTLATSILLNDYPIQNNDLLSISVSSLNPEASLLFNAPNLSTVAYSPSTGGSIQSSGYLVNSDGYIQFPVLGNIKATGLTKSQLRNELTSELKKRKLLMDPIVNIRHLNFKVTILGEVAKPTVITVPNEKITLLEALGLAGDLTVYAKRDNVMIIREMDNKKVIKRINLNSKSLFMSPYYNLMPNDVVYVEPNKAKVSGASNSRMWLPVILSGLSFTAIILDRVIK